jgi:hypothetical protein
MATQFVLNGLPKSGSTWLQTMLDSHPRIRCLKEHKLARLAARMQDAIGAYAAERRAYLGQMGQDDDGGIPEDLHQDLAVTVAHRLLDTAAEDDGDAAAYGFKDNLINPLFLLNRTDAKLVLMVRDPRDIAVSTWRFSIGNSSALLDRFGTIEAFADHYATYWINRMRERLEAVETAPDRCRLVTYEDLRRDADGELAAICGFLDVPADPADIALAVERASFENVTGDAPGAEVVGRHARKGVVGDWRNHLPAAAAEALRARCAEDARMARYLMSARS